MAPPARRHPSLLLLVVLVAATAAPSGSADGVDVTGGYSLPNCDPDPRWMSTANGTAFRASLAPLLAKLPSAAAPTGFASLRSGDGRALARGLCFGESPPPHDCRECLSLSVDRIGGCKDSRRAGFWNAGCFLAYADTNASSAGEDEQGSSSSFAYDGGGVASYYPDFYDVGRLVDMAQFLASLAANSASGRMLATASLTARASSTVRALAQCPGDVTAADCARCLERSAQELPQCLRVWGHKHDGVQSAGVANVFRYKCYLRLEISAPMLPAMAMGKGARLRRWMKHHLAVVVVVAVAMVVVVVGAALLVLKRVRSRKAQAAPNLTG